MGGQVAGRKKSSLNGSVLKESAEGLCEHLCHSSKWLIIMSVVSEAQRTLDSSAED